MPKKRQSKGGYVTRTQAIRYLQISLADFRRLCILKGIYPRDLSGRAKRKIQKGSTKPLTAYYRKDIQYLAHEPVLEKFRAHKIFARKLSRAIGRGDVGDAQRLDASRPRYTLDHIIKERYPTFVDAVGDLDDALSMLFLFAQMPASDKVSHRITEEASRLSTEWTALVARERLLRKVFVSIKGVYYQAVVHGQEVTWVVPHRFPHTITEDVDFRIMLTFLEFYTTLVHFVLFKLYTDANLIYPPPINKQREKGVGGINTYLLESKSVDSLKLPAIKPAKKGAKNGKPKVEVSISRAQQADVDASDDASESESSSEEEERGLSTFTSKAADGDVLAQPSRQNQESLFSKFTFFVGREVPLDLVEFVVLAFGGKLISEAAIDEMIDNENEKSSNDPKKLRVNLEGITHQICDRPAISNKVPGRVYVQPQWLLDSVNNGELVPVGAYAPGETLPPHLSPWGDRGTYNPAEPVASDEEDVSEHDAETEDSADPNENVQEPNNEEDEADQEAQRELKLESQGVKFSEAPNAKAAKKRKAKKPVDDDKELRKTMMTKKQRVLYDKVQGSIDKEQDRQTKLRQKRQQLRK